MPQPSPNSLPGFFLKDFERVPNTNDLWLAQGTRAVKNPGKGEYMLMLLGPDREYEKGWQGKAYPVDRYVPRGYVKAWPRGGYKVHAHSVAPDPHRRWLRQHRSTTFVSDYATARRLLIVLAREIVYDRPT